jgi:hypothetical protein
MPGKGSKGGFTRRTGMKPMGGGGVPAKKFKRANPAVRAKAMPGSARGLNPAGVPNATPAKRSVSQVGKPGPAARTGMAKQMRGQSVGKAVRMRGGK